MNKHPTPYLIAIVIGTELLQRTLYWRVDGASFDQADHLVSEHALMGFRPRQATIVGLVSDYPPSARILRSYTFNYGRTGDPLGCEWEDSLGDHLDRHGRKGEAADTWNGVTINEISESELINGWFEKLEYAI